MRIHGSKLWAVKLLLSITGQFQCIFLGDCAFLLWKYGHFLLSPGKEFSINQWSLQNQNWLNLSNSFKHNIKFKGNVYLSLIKTSWMFCYLSGMRRTSESTTNGSWSVPTTSTWNWRRACCSWKSGNENLSSKAHVTLPRNEMWEICGHDTGMREGYCHASGCVLMLIGYIAGRRSERLIWIPKSLLFHFITINNMR